MEMTEHDIRLVRVEVKRISSKRKWADADEEDFCQDVIVALLEQEQRGVKARDQDMTEGYLRTLLKRMRIDQARKAKCRPEIEFNSELVEGSGDENMDD